MSVLLALIIKLMPATKDDLKKFLTGHMQLQSSYRQRQDCALGNDSVPHRKPVGLRKIVIMVPENCS